MGLWNLLFGGPIEPERCPECGSTNVIEHQSATHWTGGEMPAYDECLDCGWTTEH